MPSSHAPTNEYFATLESLLARPTTDAELFEAIANAPFHDRLQTTHMGLGIIVLTLANPQTRTIDRVALSATEPAIGALRMTSKPFHDIKIPDSYTENLLVEVVQAGEWRQTTDWQNLFAPELTAQESRFNQAGAGIECSVVYPLKARDGGAIIFSYFEPPRKVGGEQHRFMRFYSALASAHLASGTLSQL